MLESDAESRIEGMRKRTAAVPNSSEMMSCVGKKKNAAVVKMNFAQLKTSDDVNKFEERMNCAALKTFDGMKMNVAFVSCNASKRKLESSWRWNALLKSRPIV
jgi:UDP-N-acetyl-D-mannosaminuronic acid transferase (WecB/TagA/CpsF family)